MASPNEITISQLTRLVGTPDCPLILDIRTNEDFADDPQILPTAQRYPFQDIQNFILPKDASKVIVYCQKGLKISQGAMAILRCNGIDAEYLQGGHFAWRDAGFPLIPFAKIPFARKTSGSLWVTRERPKIDRIACPWLIKRFVDIHAQFLYVSSSQVLNVAEKFDATPFDIDDTFWSHRGDNCTFDTMLEEFDLKTEPLLHLANIIRGADTNNFDLSPQSAGLMAASLGLSRMYKDDLTQLDAGMGLYDAFYRWCRDATNETHEWPHSAGKKT